MSKITSRPFYISRNECWSRRYNIHKGDKPPEFNKIEKYFLLAVGEQKFCSRMVHKITDIEITPGEYVKAWLVVEDT